VLEGNARRNSRRQELGVQELQEVNAYGREQILTSNRLLADSYSSSHGSG
jgi:hypothetical protein